MDLLEFWRFADGGWHRVRWLDLGRSYGVVAQKIATRSPALEELLVWRRWGESMDVMSYDVLAVEGPSVVRLVGRKDVPGAYVVVRRQTIEEDAGGRITRFEWDGCAYVASRVLRHLPAPVDVLSLEYTVVGGRIVGPAELFLHVGQDIRLLRSYLDPSVVRTLFSGSGIIDTGPHGFRALRPGEATISLIPDVYDRTNALEISVVVREASC